MTLGIDPGVTIGVCLLDVGASQAAVLARDAWNEDCDEMLSSKLRALLQTSKPELVAIERILDVVDFRGNVRANYAQGLALSNWIGGLLAGVARSQGVRVATPSAHEWRSSLCGTRMATDAQVKQMVRLRCPSWPAKSNPHERDAAGVALWAGLAAVAKARRGAAA